MAAKKRPAPWLKPLAHAVLALPLLWLLYNWGRIVLLHDFEALSADPVQYTIRFSGDYALRSLIAALAVSPLAKLTGWKPLIRIRRLTGLWAFTYVLIHLLCYFGMDRLFSFAMLWEDVAKRIFITIGMTAFVLLIPLAATSTNGMIKRLGAKNWQRLHKLVYIIGPLGVWHYFMMIRGHQYLPWYHAGVLAFLLGYRLFDYARFRFRRSRLQRAAE